MARIPYTSAADATPDVARALGRLPALNVFGLLGHADTAFVPWLRLGGAFLSDLALDPLLRELTILRVGSLAQRYEWDQHVPIAREQGASDTQIDALARGEITADCFTGLQGAVLAFTTAIVVDGEVEEATFATLRSQLDDRRIVELAMVAGQYLGLARIMTALRIDLDEPAGPAALGALRPPG